MDPSSLPQTPTAPPAGDFITVTDLPPAQQQQAPAVAPAAQGTPGDARFTAADLERVRQEEKDKLYSRLQKSDERFSSMETELSTLRQEREARLAQQKTEDEQAEQKRLAELTAKQLLDETRASFEEKFANLQQERELERAALEKEAEYNRLKAYAQERVSASRDEIAPELLDLVNGNTQEEIDASIETLKAKTQAILDGVRQGQEQTRSQMRGVQPTGFTGMGPLDNESGQRNLSADQIKNMSMAEYERYRAQLIGEKAARNDPRRSNTGVGLFG
jgi:hypothetical protein